MCPSCTSPTPQHWEGNLVQPGASAWPHRCVSYLIFLLEQGAGGAATCLIVKSGFYVFLVLIADWRFKASWRAALRLHLVDNIQCKDILNTEYLAVVVTQQRTVSQNPSVFSPYAPSCVLSSASQCLWVAVLQTRNFLIPTLLPQLHGVSCRLQQYCQELVRAAFLACLHLHFEPLCPWGIRPPGQCVRRRCKGQLRNEDSSESSSHRFGE